MNPFARGAVVNGTDTLVSGMADRGLRGENILDPQAAARDLLSAGATPAVGAGLGAATRLGRGGDDLNHFIGGGGETLYHGTDPDAAIRLLNGEPLSAERAAANSLREQEPGFYLATNEGDAWHFGARRNGTVIQYDMSARAVADLEAAGTIRRPIGGGPGAPTFAGDEVIVPPSAFERFNRLRDEGEIDVRPA
jgi:hypothetical protein